MKLEPILCPCGCNRYFTPKNHQHVYIDKAHKQRALRQRAKTRNVSGDTGYVSAFEGVIEELRTYNAEFANWVEVTLKARDEKIEALENELKEIKRKQEKIAVAFAMNPMTQSIMRDHLHRQRGVRNEVTHT